MAAGAGANVVWHGELDREGGGVGEAERVGARYSVVGADQARCAAILMPRVSHSVPLPGGAGIPGRALGPFEGS